MIKLNIFDWGKVKREVDFVGYNADHTICFVYNEDHARRSLILTPPHEFRLKFGKNPIPNFQPIKIARAALRLPTCFASKSEMEIFCQPLANWPPNLKAAPLNELIELVNPEKAWIEPKDEKKLAKILAEEIRRLRREYEERKREIAKHPVDHRDRESRDLETEFATRVRGDSLGSSKMISVFDVTLEDAKGGALGLRDKLLHEEFAQTHDLDLAAIPDEARRFRHWIAKSVVSIKHLNEARWKMLEMRVRYEIAFSDGTRCWLDEIKETELTDPHQIEEFDKLEAAAEATGDERLRLDDVCRALTVERKGESKSMSTKGLEKLCAKAGVPFKFPMRRSIVKKLQEYRRRRRRDLNEKLRNRNKKADI